MAGVIKDDITPALNNLLKDMQGPRNILLVANSAKALMVNRTLSGESLSGSSFASYSDREYYAPIDNRQPGYPTPKGGRKTKKGMVFNQGYSQYKTGIGRPATPQLSVSGRMLGDIQVNVLNKNRAIIFFGSQLSAKKAHGHHYGKYPFFGIQAEEQTDVMKALEARLLKLRGMQQK